MKQFDNLLKHVQDLKEDFEKFYMKDNKTAGTRIRKGMQDLKEMAQKIRVEVQDKKNKAAAKPAAKPMKK
jgi:hypothetical protein